MKVIFSLFSGFATNASMAMLSKYEPERENILTGRHAGKLNQQRVDKGIIAFIDEMLAGFSHTKKRSNELNY